MGYLFTLNTDFISISAQPEYIEYESSPVEGIYVWVYNIKITNNGKHPVQLLNRYWHITDGTGTIQEVRGPGVVGVQPIIMPGESYDYSSSVSLRTPTGIMHGEYEFKDNDEKMFCAQTPVFSLDSTETIRLAN